MKIQSHRLSRQMVAFMHDLTMAAVSFVAALVLRLGVEGVPFDSTNLWLALVLFTVVCGTVFWTTGLYQGIWRYASLNDLVAGKPYLDFVRRCLKWPAPRSPSPCCSRSWNGAPARPRSARV